MNLSQILNPPGPSSSPLPPTSSHSHRQTRASSPPLPSASTASTPPPSTAPSLASATNVIRFGSTPNGSSGGSSKKHPNPVSVARLEEETMTTSTGGNSMAGNYTNKLNNASSSSTAGSHQKIKPNETNAVYSTHTFRANGPNQPAKEKTLPVPITTATATLAFTQNAVAKTTPPPTATAVGGGGAGGAGSRGGTGNQLVMRSNTMQPMPSSASAAKKKPRIQGSSAAESSSFQDSFQSGPSAESRTTTAKKKPLKKASDTEIQQHPLEIRFVMTEKDGQGRLKNRKQPLSPPPQTLSPSLDTQGDAAADQEAQESSPTPDFERNADGKFRCSWPRCGKEFTVASRLTTHFRIHSGKPPYLCGYKDCQKAFHTSSSLSHHRVVHTDQSLRPYVCRHNRCGATYTQLARLITHQRTTHSGMILFIPQESSSSSSTSSSPSHPQNQFHQYVPPTTATTPTGSSQEAHNSPLQSPTSAANTPGATATTISPDVPDPYQQDAPTPATPPAGDADTGEDSAFRSIADTRPEGQRDETRITATGASGENASPQQGSLSSSTHSSTTSAGNADSSGPQRQDFQGNLSEQQSRRLYAQGTGRDDSPVTEQDEDEESDEMRQRKEAALTMASFRDLAMLQNQRQDSHVGQASAQHHVHRAQASYPSDGQHYSSSEYRQSHHHYHHSSHREYPPDTYQQQHHQHSGPAPRTSSAYAPSSGPPMVNGSHPYDAHHGEARPEEAHWKHGHARVGSDQYESDGYTRHGQNHTAFQQGQESFPSDRHYHDSRQTSHHHYAQPPRGQQHSRHSSYSEQTSQ